MSSAAREPNDPVLFHRPADTLRERLASEAHRRTDAVALGAPTATLNPCEPRRVAEHRLRSIVAALTDTSRPRSASSSTSLPCRSSAGSRTRMSGLSRFVQTRSVVWMDTKETLPRIGNSPYEYNYGQYTCS